MNILITAGGTKEYIDGVRYIGNCSSGRTGALLAEYLTEMGHQVTWLGACAAIKPQQVTNQVNYETFDELAEHLKQQLQQHAFDVIFQAAAVSDFKVSAVVLDGTSLPAGRGVKLPTASQMQIELTQQPKLVSHLKQWSQNKDLTVVAFKLTNSADAQVRQAAVDKLIQQSAIDFVAHNDLNDFDEQQHAFRLFSKTGSAHCQDIQAVADHILKTTEVAA